MASKQSDLILESRTGNRPDEPQIMSRTIISWGSDALRRRNKQRKTVHNGVSDPGGKPQTPDRTEEIIAVATLWTRQRGEKLR